MNKQRFWVSGQESLTRLVQESFTHTSDFTELRIHRFSPGRKKKKNVLLLETKNHVTIGKRFWRCDRNQSDAPHNIADVCVESIVVCLNCRSFCRFALFSIFCWATFFIVQLLCMRLCRSVCLLLSGICSFVSPSCLKLVCPACMYRMSASCHSDELVVNQVCSGVILSLL